VSPGQDMERAATTKDIYCILSALDRRVLRRWWICRRCRVKNFAQVFVSIGLKAVCVKDGEEAAQTVGNWTTSQADTKW